MRVCVSRFQFFFRFEISLHLGLEKTAVVFPSFDSLYAFRHWVPQTALEVIVDALRVHECAKIRKGRFAERSCFSVLGRCVCGSGVCIDGGDG